jgi:hypothetical protein
MASEWKAKMIMKLAIRSRKVCSIPTLLIAPLLVLAMGSSALAALGGGPDTVAQDRAHFNAKDEQTQTATHTVHEMQLASGARLREYVSNSGTVFAVSWVSPVRPDLKQLMGASFSQYAQQLKANTQRHGPVVVRTDTLVVESAGHMRGFVGHAYIPSLMPKGVTANDLQ